MAETKIVRIRRSGGAIVQGCDVYIGRRLNQGGWSLPQSPWANPFVIGADGTREEVLEKYKAYVAGKPELMALLPTLKGKTLGCWCKPAACHGDVLIELLEKM